MALIRRLAVLAALSGMWTLAPAGALASEDIVVYEYKAEAEVPKDRAAEEAAPEKSLPERTLSGSRYSVGLLAGYGISLGHKPHLEFVESLPAVTIPISGVMGRTFYRGVMEYKIEPVLGVVVNRSDRGEAGLSPVGFRYNFTAAGGRLVPYVEGSLGGVYLNVHKDIQGSRFNFIEGAGLGVLCFAGEKAALNIQARYRHLSNAGIRDPNHGVNTAYLLLGMTYY